jgi:hypothetical protein
MPFSLPSLCFLSIDVSSPRKLQICDVAHQNQSFRNGVKCSQKNLGQSWHENVALKSEASSTLLPFQRVIYSKAEGLRSYKTRHGSEWIT